MDDEQSDLFTDIHLADRFCAAADDGDQPPRSTTEKTDGEDVSARLFDDIHALANPYANAVIPESASAPIALESVPDFALSRDDARSVPLDGSIGTDPSFFAPVSAPLKRRRGEMRRVGTQTRLRIDHKFRGPFRAIIFSASRSPPMGSRPKSARGPPQSSHEADANPNLWWVDAGLPEVCDGGGMGNAFRLNRDFQ